MNIANPTFWLKLSSVWNQGRKCVDFFLLLFASLSSSLYCYSSTQLKEKNRVLLKKMFPFRHHTLALATAIAFSHLPYFIVEFPSSFSFDIISMRTPFPKRKTSFTVKLIWKEIFYGQKEAVVRDRYIYIRICIEREWEPVL